MLAMQIGTGMVTDHQSVGDVEKSYQLRDGGKRLR
jgi:hypothetical protein